MSTSPSARLSPVYDPGDSSAESPYAHLDPLLTDFARTPVDDPARRVMREQLIAGYLPVVRNVARRYQNRGEPIDDLEQVAVIGLLKALDRFDPTRGSDFLSYLVPTVTGEVRRHFRDRTWSIRVPRRLKDLQQPVRHATEVLSLRLHRAPRPSEIAAHLGVAVEDVVDALQAQNAYSADSLDAAMGSTDTALGDLLGRAEEALQTVEYRESLRQALAGLSERDRAIVVLRFFGDLTQTQIATTVGISQMHVSRLLTRTLQTLRTQLDPD